MDAPDLLSINNSIRPIAAANMAAVVGMTILYGVYLLVFPVCAYLLVRRQNSGEPINWILLLAVVIQFTVTTISFVSQQSVMFKSFVGLADRPNALIEIVNYWNGISMPALRISNVCSLINVALGDAIMVWRVWIMMHDRSSWICLPPIITLIGSTCWLLACGSVMLHGLWQGNRSSLFVRNWAVSAWTLGIGTQAYSTSLIAWEVWKRGVTTTASSRSQSSYYKAIISMIIESGALYTSLVLPLAIAFGLGATAASLVIAGLLNPMSGLIPASMVIRVCMNRNRKFQTTFLSQVREDQSVDGRNDSGGSSEAGIGITFSKSHHPEKAEVDI